MLGSEMGLRLAFLDTERLCRDRTGMVTQLTSDGTSCKSLTNINGSVIPGASIGTFEHLTITYQSRLAQIGVAR